MLLHELGHALVGRWQGFQWLTVGPFRWSNEADQVRFRWNTDLHTAGGMVLSVLTDTDQFDDWGILGLPKDYHAPRIPGFGEIDWSQFMAALMAVGYDGPVCIEVEDDTFGKTLAGRKRAITVAGNVLKPFFA